MPLEPLLEPASQACLIDGNSAGNPILPATREKYRAEDDFVDRGPAPLTLTRYYRSNWGLDRDRSKAGLGSLWTHNHAIVLRTDYSRTSIVSPEGFVRTFSKGSNPNSNRWVATNSSDTLTQGSEGIWKYRQAENDALYIFNADGKPVKRTERNGWKTTYQYDIAGQLTAVTNPFGRTLQFSYSPAGQLISATTPDGRIIGYSFDSTGRLNAVTFPGGKTRSFLYENTAFVGALTGIVDEIGSRWGTFDYDAQGRAISTELAGGAERYQASYAGSLSTAPYTADATVVDPLGVVRTYRYGGQGGKLAVIGGTLPSASGKADAAARTQNAEGLVTLERDFMGIEMFSIVDPARRLTTSVQRAYNTPVEQKTAYEWHPTFALPTKITEPGRITVLTYDDAGNRLSKTVTDTSVSPTTSATTSWTYNSRNLVASETAPNGAVTSYVYDALGNVKRAINALGHPTTYEYDSANRIVSSTAPKGLVTTFSWDARDRLLSQTAGSETTTFTWRPTGQLASVALPSGLIFNYSYDAAQRLIGWGNNRGESGSYTLDAMGNHLGERVNNSTGGIARTVARSINALNRVQTETVGDNLILNHGYDANGELVSSSNASGATTAYGRDALRRIASITNSLNAAATLRYDGLDAVTGASDFKGSSTQYSRDASGHATREASADAGEVQTSYDALGLPSRILDALGQATDITRDALGRPTLITWPDTSGTTLRYDLAGGAYNVPDAPNASRGYLSELQDPGVTTRYQRDVLGRVTQKLQILEGATPANQKVGYSYVASGPGTGQLASIAYPRSGTLGHQYDATGQLTGLTWNDVPLISDIRWNALGQPTGWVWSFVTGDAPLTATRSYDSAGRLAASELASYQYDAAGIISKLTQSVMAPSGKGGAKTVAPLQVETTIRHDTEGRITGLQHALAAGAALPAGLMLSSVVGPLQASYAYDANGNRTRSNYEQPSAVPGAMDALMRGYQLQDGSNRVLGYTQTSRFGGTASTVSNNFQYDAAGHIISTGTNANAAANDKTYTLRYGASGRLIQAHPSGQPSQASSYLHNLLGQRVLKTSPATGTEPAGMLATLYGEAEHGMESQPLGQYDSAGVPKTEYIYLPTAAGPMPIAVIVGGKKYAVQSDHLNTPRRLVQQNGQVAWQWTYSAFGEVPPTLGATRFVSPLADPGAINTAANPAPVAFDLRYPGQLADAESGLFYNHHRSYDPVMGRYTQSDPIGLAGGWNRFGYVGGNPISNSDSNGLNPITGAMTGASAGSAFGPVGTVVGGLIGAGAGAWIGWNVVGPMFRDKTPNTGESGSWHTNPGDGKPGSGQERLYGPNGQPEIDIDWHPDHGAGQPHGHNWENGRRQPGVPLSPWPRGRIINGCAAP